MYADFYHQTFCKGTCVRGKLRRQFLKNSFAENGKRLGRPKPHTPGCLSTTYCIPPSVSALSQTCSWETSTHGLGVSSPKVHHLLLPGEQSTSKIALSPWNQSAQQVRFGWKVKWDLACYKTKLRNYKIWKMDTRRQSCNTPFHLPVPGPVPSLLSELLREELMRHICSLLALRARS